MLSRFWFTFEKTNEPSILDVGCGITAFSLADADTLLHAKVIPAYGSRKVANVKENIDVSTLDPKHIRPNMGNPAIRGVWFPLT